jgi:hypothetical protein
VRKLLVVYNTCGILGKDNTDYYIDSLLLMLSQKFDDFHIVISDCCTKPGYRDKLVNIFGEQVSYNFIDDAHPVNVTFNHTCITAREQIGEFQGYFYVDSGVRFTDDDNAFTKMYERLSTGKYGIVTARMKEEHDSGYSWGLGVEKLPPKDYLVPIGKACNGQVNIFHHSILDYYSRIIPDIFASYCTESVFGFIAAALKKQWVICCDVPVDHAISLDGSSAMFLHEKRHDHVYLLNKSMLEILRTPESERVGMGYEEYRGVFRHDESQYDENYLCKNDELKEFIKTACFLPKSVLDYSTIRHTFYNHGR